VLLVVKVSGLQQSTIFCKKWCSQENTSIVLVLVDGSNLKNEPFRQWIELMTPMKTGVPDCSGMAFKFMCSVCPSSLLLQIVYLKSIVGVPATS